GGLGRTSIDPSHGRQINRARRRSPLAPESTRELLVWIRLGEQRLPAPLGGSRRADSVREAVEGLRRHFPRHEYLLMREPSPGSSRVRSPRATSRSGPGQAVSRKGGGEPAWWWFRPQTSG